MDSIRFKNYRCFEDTGDVALKPLTFLLGANSSGKSSFLEFFPLLKQSVGVRRNGIFLWYSNEVDFKDFDNTVKSGENSMEISIHFDNFVVNEGRSAVLLKKIPNGKELQAEEIGLTLTMRISRQRDYNDQLEMLKINFHDEEIILEFDNNSRVKASINGRLFPEDKFKMRFNDSTFLLPRIFFIFKTSDGTYSSVYPRFIDEPDLFENLLTQEIRESIFYNDNLYLNKSNFETLFKEVVKKENADYDLMRDVYLLANINDIIEEINYRINAEAAQLSYVKPLRVMTERYYRYQNYSVDDIDSDGKNLAI